MTPRPRAPARRGKARATARRIAAYLFTYNGYGSIERRATRLVMEVPGWTLDRDTPGWCEEAVVDAITRHLNEITPRPRGRRKAKR